MAPRYTNNVLIFLALLFILDNDVNGEMFDKRGGGDLSQTVEEQITRQGKPQACLKVFIRDFVNRYNSQQDNNEDRSPGCCDSNWGIYDDTDSDTCDGERGALFHTSCDHTFKVMFKYREFVDRVVKEWPWTGTLGDDKNYLYFERDQMLGRVRNNFTFCDGMEYRKHQDGSIGWYSKPVIFDVTVRDVDFWGDDFVAYFKVMLDPMKFGKGITTLCLWTLWNKLPNHVCDVGGGFPFHYPNGCMSCRWAPFSMHIEVEHQLDDIAKNPRDYIVDWVPPPVPFDSSHHWCDPVYDNWHPFGLMRCSWFNFKGTNTNDELQP